MIRQIPPDEVPAWAVQTIACRGHSLDGTYRHKTLEEEAAHPPPVETRHLVPHLAMSLLRGRLKI